MTKREPITIILGEATGEPELEGLAQMQSILLGFEPRTRERMLNWLCDVFPKERIRIEGANGEKPQEKT